LSVPEEEEGVDDGDVPHERLRTIIGSGFQERTDPAALVIGPTGLGLASDGTLYVADTLLNRVAAIPNAVFRDKSAGTGRTVSVGINLNQPLGLAIAPNGDILTVNAGDGNIVETTPGGSQIAVMNIDTSGAGAGTLFGLAVTLDHKGISFVDDGDNTLDLLH
jgi:sugar lactone lactonase YvrE